MVGLWLILGISITAALAALPLCLSARGKSGEDSDDIAQDRLAELSQLAGGLAHEIKNPLSTINLNLRLLAEDIQRHDDEEHRRWLRRLVGVQEESDRLKATLDDFLRLAGKMELSAAPTDLRSVADELINFFAPQAEAGGVVLRSDLPTAPVVCNIDVKLIKQALLNLLLNATQAMTDGGEMIVKVSAHGDDALLEVIDTGPGLAPEDIDKIFNVHYSTKTGGSGLGLPTTRRIVHEHGGDIRVESEPGKGTRFVIDLPAEQQTPNP